MSKAFQSVGKLTAFEIAAIVGKRASQLENGDPARVPVNKNTATFLSIAYDELVGKKLGDFVIQRRLPNGRIERISLDALPMHL